jgi:hypothetical protein
MPGVSAAGPDASAPLRLASVFDLVDPVTGPAFADDHPTVDDDDLLALLLDRLGSGTAVLMTTTGMDDVVDRSRTGAVPLHFRTDGSWIWSDAVGYYLERYRLAPEPELLAHLRQDQETPQPPSRETVERARAFLLSPPTPEHSTVWDIA